MNTSEMAAVNSYDVFRQLFPQRHAAWDELAEWERERWRKVITAALDARPLLGDGSQLRCSAGLVVSRMVYGLAERPHAEHEWGGRCNHQIYRDGVLVYDGVLL